MQIECIKVRGNTFYFFGESVVSKLSKRKSSFKLLFLFSIVIRKAYCGELLLLRTQVLFNFTRGI